MLLGSISKPYGARQDKITAMPKPTSDDMTLMVARIVRKKLTVSLPDEVILFITTSGLALLRLLEKHKLPHEEKLLSSYMRKINLIFECLDEVKRAIEKDMYVDNEIIDDYIQELHFHPEQPCSSEQAASYVLVLTTGHLWVYEEFPKLDDKSTAKLIVDFIELNYKELEGFSGWGSGLSVN